jgi:hypothetical protein
MLKDRTPAIQRRDAIVETPEKISLYSVHEPVEAKDKTLINLRRLQVM